MNFFQITAITALIVFAVQFAYVEYKAVAIPANRSLLIIFFVIFCGIFCARVNLVMLFLDYFIKYPVEVLKIWKGGIVYTGSVIGAIAGVILIKLKFRSHFRVLSTLDSIAISLPIPHIIGRIGCLISGCCFGCPTGNSWGISYPASNAIMRIEGFVGVPLHPAQVYDMVVELISLLLLCKFRKKLQTGSLFGLYLATYCSLRFIEEFFRLDKHMIRIKIGSLLNFNFTNTQIVCLALALLGTALLVFLNSKFVFLRFRKSILSI